jgi:hypothetical protein
MVHLDRSNEPSSLHHPNFARQGFTSKLESKVRIVLNALILRSAECSSSFRQLIDKEKVA